MGRNPVKDKEIPEAPTPEHSAPATPQGVVVEREITLSLINDKLNYAIGLLHEIAKACEIDLTKISK
jgi:hypothetical protein